MHSLSVLSSLQQVLCWPFWSPSLCPMAPVSPVTVQILWSQPRRNRNSPCGDLSFTQVDWRAARSCICVLPKPRELCVEENKGRERCRVCPILRSIQMV